MERLQNGLTWVFEHLLVVLLQVAFYAFLLIPGLAALLMVSVKAQMVTAAGPLWFILARLDSGMQLGLGAFIMRGWLVALSILMLVLGAEVPARLRGLWRAAWFFHGCAMLSGLFCSHPFEGLLTALDVALLNVVALLACIITPSEWIPRLLCLSAGVVSAVSLFDFLASAQVVPDLDRLNGTFYQPNMTATYLACSLPWILNQELGKARDIGKALLWLVIAGLVILTLALTQTRAAWVASVLGLCGRWFLAARLRQQPFRWFHVLPVAAICGLALVLLYLAAIYSVWAALVLGLLLLLGALLGGGGKRQLVLFLLAVAIAACSYGPVRHWTAPQPVDSMRVQDLAEAKDISLLARVEFFRAALLMGWQHPLLGVGPRGFHRYYPSCQTDERWFSKFAHSSALSVWAELGALGTVAFLLFCGLLLRHLAAALRHPDAEARLRVLDAVTAAGIFGLCSLVDVQWQFPILPVTFAAWLGYALSDQSAAEAPAPPPPPPQEVGAWTLRPHVVFTYFQVSCLAIFFFLNLLWSAAHYYNELGEMVLERNHPDEAIDLCRRATVLNPYQGSFFHQLGLCMVAARIKNSQINPDALVRVAQQAVARDSHRAVHWDLLAKAYLAKGDKQKVVQCIHKALECDPVNYPSFYTALAEQYPVPQERTERILILESCMQRFPAEALGRMMSFRSADIERQLTSVYLSLADLYNAATQPRQALSFYDRLLQINPKEPNARLGRLVCLINLDQLKVAHKEALDFYRADPRPEVLDVIKHIYYWEHIPLDPRIFGKSPFPAKPGAKP